jgi:hypothetical protein
MISPHVPYAVRCCKPVNPAHHRAQSPVEPEHMNHANGVSPLLESGGDSIINGLPNGSSPSMHGSWWSLCPRDCIAMHPSPVAVKRLPRLHGAACSCKDRHACFLFPNMQDFLALIRPLAVVLNENVMQSLQRNVVFHRCPFDPGHKMPFVPQNTHKSIIHYRTSHL